MTKISEDRAVPYSGTINNNVIKQKLTRKINSPVTMEVSFVGKGVSIPGSVDGGNGVSLKLKSQSITNDNYHNVNIEKINAIYEQSYNLNGYLSFSGSPNITASSNYFPYHNANSGSNESEFNFPNWKVYLNNQKYIKASSVASELTGKGGYIIDYENKTFKKLNLSEENLEGDPITSADIIDSYSINLRKNINDSSEQIYIEAKQTKQPQKAIFLEKPEDTEENTTYEGDSNPSVPPENIDSLHDLSMNHDVSGETKFSKEVTYENGKIIKEKYEKWGYEYTAEEYANIKTEIVDGEEVQTLELDVPKGAAWKKIEKITKKYEYSSEGYLLRIDESGWKKGRFRQESDDIFETFFLSGRDAEEEKNLDQLKDFQFKKFPIKGLLERQYYPLRTYYNYSDKTFNDYFIVWKVYNEAEERIDIIYKKNKNWTDPYFLTSEYYYSACIGYSYNRFINADGEYEYSEDDVLTPDIFGHSKGYKKEFKFFSNKNDTNKSFGGLGDSDLNIEYLNEDEDPYYIETKTIYQSGNTSFREVAEKTEKNTVKGIPPEAPRKVSTVYEYDVINSSEPYFDLPEGYGDSDYKIYTVKAKSSSSGLNLSGKDKSKIFEVGSYVKPNNYDFATSANIQQALGNSVVTIKTDKTFNIGDIVSFEGIPEPLLVTFFSEVIDTTDKFSNGLFPDGSVRTHFYNEVTLASFDFFEDSTSIASPPDDENIIELMMPPIQGGSIGSSITDIKSKVSNIPNRGNAVLPIDGKTV